MKADILNSDSYLFTINEARGLLRISREKFINEYVKTGKIPLTLREDGQKMIRHGHLKAYLDERQRVYETN